MYDGDCAFCRRWVERIARWDTRGVFEFAARQSEGILQRFPKLAEGDFNTGLRLVAPDDTVYVGADAVHEIARRLRYWCWAAWLYRVPGIHGLSRAAYTWVAAHRRRLSGPCNDQSCKPA